MDPQLITLIHRKEFKKSVGTARLVHLSIRNSIAWMGDGPDFEKHEGLQRLLADPLIFPVVVFPGTRSFNLSRATSDGIQDWIPPGRRLAIILVDGSWSLARFIIRSCPSLRSLPAVSFDVEKISQYRFRRQPRPYCLSTVEAAHLLIEHLHQLGLTALPAERAHDRMLETFDWIVESQLKFGLR